MKEVNKEKEELVNEGTAARTRPTSVEEIMLRRKRKEALENAKEETVELPGDDIVDNRESDKGHDRSKKVRRAERVKESLSKREDSVSSSKEDKVEKSMREDAVGAAQSLINDLVEKVYDDHVSGRGHARDKKVRSEERVKDSSSEKPDAVSHLRDEKTMKEDLVGPAESQTNYHVSEREHDRGKKVSSEERGKDSSSMKEDSISSSREEKLEKPMLEDPIGAVESQTNYHVSERGHDRGKKVRSEERVTDSSSKKEDSVSSSREEKLEKPMLEDSVGAAQSQTNDIVEKVSDYHVSERGHDRSTKGRSEERVKDSSSRKDAISHLREEKPLKEDPVVGTPNDLVEKVSDHHASGRRHDRSKKGRREERVKESSRKKEDGISISGEEKGMTEEPVGTGQLLGKDLVEKVSGYPKSDRSENTRREERVKDSSRKKEETIHSSREERLDKPKREEEPSANRKRKAEGELSRAETKLVEGHDKDRRRRKEETNSSYKEDRLDIKVHPQDTGREQARSALENLPGSRKRLRSLVVVDKPREENRMKPDDGNKINNHNGDDKKNKERNISKRHDTEKVYSGQVSERWEKREQSKSHQRGTREKRRRSRSRDHGHDRQKRSSPLPRAEKATSRHKRSHEEDAENADKDKSRKRHYNDNDNKEANTVNNTSRRHSDSKSELGGYSPRKRREDTSAKAASPPNLSSEKRSGKWDPAPTVTAGIVSGSVISGLQAATQTAYPIISEASLTHLKPLLEAPFKTHLAMKTTSFDSVQLTESTRLMRRLYAENVPESASEKSLIEYFNGYMLSSGSNHIKGSKSCISCIINKEKSQALVEFLTPQDASAALSLDGCSFAGSNLKIRRPKDYVETTSGELEKMEPTTIVRSDHVGDSSNKIFIGGFPQTISSEMLMKIVSVFGPLKAYRFVITNDLSQRCAFLEYTDGSVTPKACAGLNGMKLGGNVITAVCALPDASSVTVNENPPFYGIPEHAKPLLGKPKHILNLKNVVDPELLPSLSEPEVKEILEDVRFECSRFGVIKSINIVKHQSQDIMVETDESLNPESKEMSMSTRQEKDEESKKADDTADSVDPEEVVRPDTDTAIEETLCEPSSDTAVETNTQANEDHDTTGQDHCEKVVGESAQEKAENPQEVVRAARAVKSRWDTGLTIEEEEQNPKDVFEPGCIFIEYRRPEATRDAAHSLHGRLYENRIVKAEYVSKELYQSRFPSV